MHEFQRMQYQFTRYLRQPELQTPPSAIERRRLAIYRDLIYNNIESFIRGAFPVLRSILADDHWHKMLGVLFAGIQIKSLYFLELSQRFLINFITKRVLLEVVPGFWLSWRHFS